MREPNGTASWLNIVQKVVEFHPPKPENASRKLDVVAGILSDGELARGRGSAHKVATPASLSCHARCKGRCFRWLQKENPDWEAGILPLNYARKVTYYYST